jgi:hypothetical protein
MPTVADVLASGSAAMDGLAGLGEAVEDEWQYVSDLRSVWSARFAEVLAARGREPAAPSVEDAVGRAAQEAVSITDPHRAIDWLSTLPQIVLSALDEPT